MSDEKTMPSPQPQKLNSKNSLTKFLEKPWFWIVAVVLLFGVPITMSLLRPQPELPPVLGTMPDFELLNQNAEPVTAESLRGSVLVVNFIFTSCPDVCPLLSRQMEKIQSRLLGKSPTVRLLSISVDPETDTPPVLKKYAEKYNAEHRTWQFLTGPLQDITRVVVDGFRSGLDREAVEGDENRMDALFAITHGEHFVIVDQLGQIRAYKHAKNDAQINDILKTIALVANSKPSAASKAR